MPEYLAPGVFIEEVSFRQKPIEGVSTSTTAFVGPTRDGPIFGEPPLLTSEDEFSRIYGGMDPLEYLEATHTNFVAQAVRAYFAEGGKRLYVARVFHPRPRSDENSDEPEFLDGYWSDGIARWSIDDESSIPGSPPDRVSVRARYPGAAGNRLVTFRFRMGPNILDTNAEPPTLRGVGRFEVVWVQTEAQAADSQPEAGSMYWVDPYYDDRGRRRYRLRRDDPANATQATGTITDLGVLQQVRLVTVSVEVVGRGRYRGRFDETKSYDDLAFHPARMPPGPRRSVTEEFAADPSPGSTTALFVPIVLETNGLVNGVEVAEAIAGRNNIADTGTVIFRLGRIAMGGDATEDDLSCVVEVRGGNDGERPDPTDYEGVEDPDGSGATSGLLVLEDLEDISILAAPGSSYNGLNGYADNMRSITGLLLSHCERMRYRVAVLDSANGARPGQVRDQRASLDSKYGALYYPWVRAFDEISGTQVHFPPSGFVTGIYARSDVERGVHKAPANEVVRLATGFEMLINNGQQELLNPLGINCLRYFEGRGFRVWGARTITSDQEWKYINLRRNFAYLGRSIEIGTQWAVFEPNAEVLWSNVRRSVESFLYNEWKSGRLMGVNPDEAYFVRCDRTTMTQADIDSGRLICLVGVALLRPAEFIIFRIGQKTLDFKG